MRGTHIYVCSLYNFTCQQEIFADNCTKLFLIFLPNLPYFRRIFAILLPNLQYFCRIGDIFADFSATTFALNISYMWLFSRTLCIHFHENFAELIWGNNQIHYNIRDIFASIFAHFSRIFAHFSGHFAQIMQTTVKSLRI